MSSSYHPRFDRSALLVRRLVEAASLAAWIREQTLDVSWIGPSQKDALVRQAHYSTRIEGNPLTLPEVQALAAGADLPVEERAKREVLNYFAALRWIWRDSPPKEVLEKDLLRVHGLLTRGTLPPAESGAYKTRPNAVFDGPRVLHRPPPPEAAPLLTRALVGWLNSTNAMAEHAVVVSAVAHHRLVSIHPFSDGNGRAARALGGWLLYRRGFDSLHLFALDEFFEADRARYYREIQKVRERKDDLSSWLEYAAEGVAETLRRTQGRIQAIRAPGRSSRLTLTRAQERILQVLGESTPLGGGDLARSLRLSRSHLSKLLKPLLDAGLIVKEGSTKAARYHPA